jgi:DNA-binding transcriptional ArsR family regulator
MTVYTRAITPGGEVQLPAMRVVRAMEEAASAVSRHDIAAATGLSLEVVSVSLTVLRAHHVVRQVSRGCWVLLSPCAWLDAPK